MKIEIAQDDVEMTITKSTPLTSELFEVYIKHFNKSNKYDKPLCEDCKEEIKNYAPGKKYCDDCKNKRKQEQVNEWKEKNPEKNKEYQELKTIRKNLREDVVEEKETEYISQEWGEKEKPLKDRKIMFRAPNNTALFLNWLESNHITEFETTDFVDAYTSMNVEAAEKIISHQIHKNIVTQLGNNSFKVNWTKLKEELK